MYTCGEDVFKQTYTPVAGSAHEYRKTGHIIARQIHEPFSIKTATGAIEHGLADDFLVQNEAQEQWVIECHQFHELYEVALSALISDDDDDDGLPYTDDTKTGGDSDDEDDDGSELPADVRRLSSSLELHPDDLVNIRNLLSNDHSDSSMAGAAPRGSPERDESPSQSSSGHTRKNSDTSLVHSRRDSKH